MFTKSVGSLIERNQNKALNELPTDARNLFEFLVLVVDIEHRRRYGSSIDWQEGRGYSKNHKEVLADQLPPVDNVESARLTSTGDN